MAWWDYTSARRLPTIDIGGWLNSVIRPRPSIVPLTAGEGETTGGWQDVGAGRPREAERPALGMGDLRLAEEAAARYDIPLDALLATVVQPEVERPAFGMADFRVAEEERAAHPPTVDELVAQVTSAPEPEPTGANVSDILGSMYGAAQGMGDLRAAEAAQPPDEMLDLAYRYGDVERTAEEQMRSLTAGGLEATPPAAILPAIIAAAKTGREAAEHERIRPYTPDEMAAWAARFEPRGQIVQMLAQGTGRTPVQIEQAINDLPSSQRDEINAQITAVAQGIGQAQKAANLPTLTQIQEEMKELRAFDVPDAEMRRLQEDVMAGRRRSMTQIEAQDVAAALRPVLDTAEGVKGAVEGLGDIAGRIGGKAATPLLAAARLADQSLATSVPTGTVVAPALLGAAAGRVALGELEKRGGLEGGLHELGNRLGEIPGNVVGGVAGGLQSWAENVATPMAGRTFIEGELNTNTRERMLAQMAGKPTGLVDRDRKAILDKYGITPPTDDPLLLNPANYDTALPSPWAGATPAQREQYKAAFDVAPAWAQLLGGAVADPATYVGGAPARALTRVVQGTRVGRVATKLDDLARVAEEAAQAGGKVEEMTQATEWARQYRAIAQGLREDFAALAPGGMAAEHKATGVAGRAAETAKATLGTVAGAFTPHADTGEMMRLRAYVDQIENRLLPASKAVEDAAYDGVKLWAETYTPRSNLFAGNAPRELMDAVGDILSVNLQGGFPLQSKALSEATTAFAKNPSTWLLKKINLVGETPAAFRARVADAADTFIAAAVPNLNDGRSGTVAKSVAALRTFIFDPEGAQRVIGPGAVSRDGRLVSRILREHIQTPEAFSTLMKPAHSAADVTAIMQATFDDAAARLLPDPKHNPIQVFTSALKNAVYSPLWLGTRPGYVIGNAASNAWAMADGGVPRLVGNETWYRSMGFQAPTKGTKKSALAALRAQGVTSPTDAQVLDMQIRLGVTRAPVSQARRAGQGIGAAGERPTGGMARLAFMQRAAQDVETRFSLGYWRLGAEDTWRRFSRTIPTATLDEAGLSAYAEPIRAAAANWTDLDTAAKQIKTIIPGTGVQEPWRLGVVAFIDEIRALPGGGDVADMLKGVLNKADFSMDEWMKAVAKAQRSLAYARVPAGIRQEIADQVDNLMPKTVSTLTAEEAEAARDALAAGRYNPGSIKLVEDEMRRDFWTSRLVVEPQMESAAKQIELNLGKAEADAFRAAHVGALNKLGVQYDQALQVMDNRHAVYRGELVLDPATGQKAAGLLPDGTPGPLSYGKGDATRGDAWIRYFKARDTERFDHFTTWNKKYEDAADAIKVDLDQRMGATQGGTASAQAAATDAAKLDDLAARIARGEKIISLDDLQLQANYPQELEARLRKAQGAAPSPAAAQAATAASAQASMAATKTVPANTLGAIPHLADDVAKHNVATLKAKLVEAGSVSDVTAPLPQGAAPEDVLTRWLYGEVQPWMATRRQMAMSIGNATRDFAILNYTDRRNFDPLLGMGVPFHFWQTRQYANTVQRVLQQPSLLSAYMRYRQQVDTMNADLPPEYRGYYGLQIPGLSETIYLDPAYLLNPFQALDDRVTRAQAKTPAGEAAARVMGFVGRPYPWLNGLAASLTGTAPEAWQSTRFLPVTPPVQYATGLLGANKGRGIDIERPFREVGVVHSLTQPITGLRTIGVGKDDITSQLDIMLREKQAHPVTKLGITAGDVSKAISTKDALWWEAQRQATNRLGRYDTENPRTVAEELWTMLDNRDITQDEYNDAIVGQDAHPAWREAARRTAQRVSGEKTARYLTGLGLKRAPTAGELAADEATRRQELTYQIRDQVGEGPYKAAAQALYAEYPALSGYNMANDIPEVRREWRDVQAYFEEAGSLFEKNRQIEGQIDALTAQIATLKGKKDAESTAAYNQMQEQLDGLYGEQQATSKQIDALRGSKGLTKLQIADADTRALARLAPEQYQAQALYEAEKSKIYDRYADAMKGFASKDKTTRDIASTAYAKREQELIDLEHEFEQKGALVIPPKEKARTEARAERLAVSTARSADYDALGNLPPGTRKYQVITYEEGAALDGFYDNGGNLDGVTDPQQRTLIESALVKARALAAPDDDERKRWEIVRHEEAEWYAFKEKRYPGIQAKWDAYNDEKAAGGHPKIDADMKGYLEDRDAFAQEHPLWAQYYVSKNKQATDNAGKGEGRPTVNEYTGQAITPEAESLNDNFRTMVEAKYGKATLDRIYEEQTQYYADKAAGLNPTPSDLVIDYWETGDEYGKLHPEWKRVYRDDPNMSEEEKLARDLNEQLYDYLEAKYGKAGLGAIKAQQAAYYAEKDAGGSPVAPETVKGYWDERTAWAAKYPVWAKYYRKASTGGTGWARGFPPNADTPGWLEYTLFPGGRPSSPIAERLNRMWRSPKAQAILHGKKEDETSGQRKKAATETKNKGGWIGPARFAPPDARLRPLPGREGGPRFRPLER